MNQKTKDLIEVVAQFSSVISTLVGIVAIYIGVWQFNAALDRADAQIEYIKQEAFERQVQNKPRLTYDTRFVSDADSIGMYLTLKNIGSRYSDSVNIDIIITDIPGLDRKYNVEYSTSHVTDSNSFYEYADIEGSTTPMTFPKSKFLSYTVRIALEYRDPILKTFILDKKYYYLKANLKLEAINDMTPYKMQLLENQFMDLIKKKEN